MTSYKYNGKLKTEFIYPCNLNGAFSRAKYYLVSRSVADKQNKVDAMVLERRYGILH